MKTLAMSLGAALAAASAAAAQVTPVTTDARSTAISIAARQAFMAGLTGAPRAAEPATSLTIQWPVYPGAASYHVLRSAANTGPFEDITPRGVPGPSATFTSLKPEQKYVFRVVPFGQFGPGADTTQPMAVNTAPWPALGGWKCSGSGGPSGFTLALQWQPMPQTVGYQVQSDGTPVTVPPPFRATDAIFFTGFGQQPHKFTASYGLRVRDWPRLGVDTVIYAPRSAQLAWLVQTAPTGFTGGVPQLNSGITVPSLTQGMGPQSSPPSGVGTQSPAPSGPGTPIPSCTSVAP